MGKNVMSLTRVLWFAGVIITLAMGIRHSFGLFLEPLSAGGGRETIAFAFAILNLLWGAAQPFAGAWADRAGARRVLVAGALAYAAGLWTLAVPGMPLLGSVMIGIGLAGTTYGVVFGVVGKLAPPHRRSQAMGLTAAAGSLGQFLLLPAGQWGIDRLGASPTLLVFAALTLLIVPLAWPLRVEGIERPSQPIGDAFREAMRHPGFLLLSASYFVCGFQVSFVGVHLPAFLADRGLSSSVGALSLALIGLANIVGTWLFGHMGARHDKSRLLSGIYACRAVAIVLFVLLPVTPASAIAFSAAIGFLWLGTVPLTNGIIAGIFGVHYLSMLGGLVFFAHQLGSFFGIWLGGRVYDSTGSYDPVWWTSVVLGVMASLLCLPIRERPLQRAEAGA